MYVFLFPTMVFLPDKLDIPAEPIWWGDAMGQEFTVYSTLLPETDIPLYLFGHQTFARRNIYGDHDEYWRFTFFC